MAKGAVNNLTEGKLGRQFYKFIVPLVITNLFQAIYNIADMMVVGQFVGKSGMSAVTTGGQITNVVLFFGVGLCGGAAVYIGQLYSLKREEDINRVIGSCFTFFLALAVIISLGVVIFVRPILSVFHTPQSAMEQAVVYLIICKIGTVFIYMYNVVIKILRAFGNSLPAMIIGASSCCINIGLDFLLTGAFHMDVQGAALATVISQCLSFLAIIVYFKRKITIFRFTREVFKIDWQKIKVVLKIGFPQAVQFTCTQFCLLLVTGLVNTFDVAASAAAGATAKVCTFAALPGQAVCGGISSYTAQNLPKQQFGRIWRSTGYGALLALSIATIFFFLTLFLPETILRIFTSDPEVLAVGSRYLILVSGGTLIENFIYLACGIVIGSGNTQISLLGSLMANVLFRVGGAFFLYYGTSLGFEGMGLVSLLSPIAALLVNGIFLITGKWKRSRVLASSQ